MVLEDRLRSQSSSFGFARLGPREGTKEANYSCVLQQFWDDSACGRYRGAAHPDGSAAAPSDGPLRQRNALFDRHSRRRSPRTTVVISHQMYGRRSRLDSLAHRLSSRARQSESNVASQAAFSGVSVLTGGALFPPHFTRISRALLASVKPVPSTTGCERVTKYPRQDRIERCNPCGLVQASISHLPLFEVERDSAFNRT